MKDGKLYQQLNDKQAILIFLLEAEIKVREEIRALKIELKVK